MPLIKGAQSDTGAKEVITSSLPTRCETSVDINQFYIQTNYMTIELAEAFQIEDSQGSKPKAKTLDPTTVASRIVVEDVLPGSMETRGCT